MILKILHKRVEKENEVDFVAGLAAYDEKMSSSKRVHWEEAEITMSPSQAWALFEQLGNFFLRKPDGPR